MAWAQCLSGKPFDMTAPTPDQVDFADMARQLARINRYLGASRLNISVARHSLNVAKALWMIENADPETVLYGLLHDGHEYVVGDIPQPVKELLAEIYGTLDPLKAVTRRIDAAIFMAAGLPLVMSESQARLVKMADARMLATEKRDFLNPSLRDWGELPPPYDCCFRHSEREEDDAAEFLSFLDNCRAAIAA